MMKKHFLHDKDSSCGRGSGSDQDRPLERQVLSLDNLSDRDTSKRCSQQHPEVSNVTGEEKKSKNHTKNKKHKNPTKTKKSKCPQKYLWLA